jgi:hypothetical protein
VEEGTPKATRAATTAKPTIQYQYLIKPPHSGQFLLPFPQHIVIGPSGVSYAEPFSSSNYHIKSSGLKACWLPVTQSGISFQQPGNVGRVFDVCWLPLILLRFYL